MVPFIRSWPGFEIGILAARGTGVVRYHGPNQNHGLEVADGSRNFSTILLARNGRGTGSFHSPQAQTHGAHSTIRLVALPDPGNRDLWVRLVSINGSVVRYPDYGSWQDLRFRRAPTRQKYFLF